MTKVISHKRDLMREQLAHQAAKLMAEDGICLLYTSDAADE